MHQEGQPTQIVNKKLYIAAAYGTNDLETTTVVDIYDPLDDKWVTAASSTPFNSSHMQSATDGRYIYMVAGSTDLLKSFGR
jgi:N-acetylneuraminic acid mutarotase